MLLLAIVLDKCCIFYLSDFQGLLIFLFFVLMNSEVRSCLACNKAASSSFPVSKQEKGNSMNKSCENNLVSTGGLGIRVVFTRYICATLYLYNIHISGKDNNLVLPF